MRFADRDVQFGRGVFEIACGVFDDQAFLAALEGKAGFFARLRAAAGGEGQEPDIAADPVLDVDDVVPVCEIGKVYVQQRARGLGMGGLESAWALDLVAPKNFGVGDDNEL